MVGGCSGKCTPLLQLIPTSRFGSELAKNFQTKNLLTLS
jgi:hypothetical protein